jgi:hypothetical protein
MPSPTCADSPCNTSAPLELEQQRRGHQSAFRDLVQARFPEIAGTSAQAKYLQTAGISEDIDGARRIFRSFVNGMATA